MAIDITRSQCSTEGKRWHVRPSQTQTSLRIRAVLSESSMGDLWVAKDPTFPQAEN